MVSELHLFILKHPNVYKKAVLKFIFNQLHEFFNEWFVLFCEWIFGGEIQSLIFVLLLG
jgi:hypothetical protein